MDQWWRGMKISRENVSALRVLPIERVDIRQEEPAIAGLRGPVWSVWVWLPHWENSDEGDWHPYTKSQSQEVKLFRSLDGALREVRLFWLDVVHVQG